MKKCFKWLMVLFMPLLSLTVTACGDDDNDNDEPGKPESEKPESLFSIIGTWQCVGDDDFGFTFYQNGKVMEIDKGNSEMTFYKFSQEEEKLWIYMFSESGVTTYPLEDMKNWDEYRISIISENSFVLSYELYGEIVSKTYRRLNNDEPGNNGNDPEPSKPDTPKESVFCNLNVDGKSLYIYNISGEDITSNLFCEYWIWFNDGEYIFDFMRSKDNPYKNGDYINFSFTYKNRDFGGWDNSDAYAVERYGRQTGTAKILQIDSEYLSVQVDNYKLVADDSEGMDFITLSGSFKTKLKGIYNTDSL